MVDKAFDDVDISFPQAVWENSSAASEALYPADTNWRMNSRREISCRSISLSVMFRPLIAFYTQAFLK
jgi:hypothetical protein